MAHAVMLHGVIFTRFPGNFYSVVKFKQAVASLDIVRYKETLSFGCVCIVLTYMGLTIHIHHGRVLRIY